MANENSHKYQSDRLKSADKSRKWQSIEINILGTWSSFGDSSLLVGFFPSHQYHELINTHSEYLIGWFTS